MSLSSNSPEVAAVNVNKNSTSAEVGVQTVVKVFPFILDVTRNHASVSSDKKFCTVLSLEASQNSKAFYSLLQYCPFHDIQENSIRVIDLPRRTKLQWSHRNHISEDLLRKLSLADDDGVAELGIDMLARMQTDKKPVFDESSTQTDILVRPYLLQEPQVATVYKNTETQVTTRGCDHFFTRRSV